MKKLILRTFLILFVLTFTIAFLKDKIVDSPQALAKKAKLLTSDSELKYTIYLWSILPMGELKLSRNLSQEKNIISLEATTKDTWINNIIQASAKVVSQSAPNSQLPERFAEITDVKGKVKEKEILFDQKNLIATRGDAKLKIPEQTHDPISAFVYAINLDYKSGKILETKFLSKRDIYTLKSFLVKEDNGLYEIDITMKRENLTSSHGAHFSVWVTADFKRNPVLFKALTPIGYVSVILGGNA